VSVELYGSARDVSDSIVETRKCKKCGIDKPLIGNFPRNKVAGKIYYRYQCNSCVAVADRKWRIENNERARATDNSYYARNKENKNYQRRQRRNKNPQVHRDENKKWRLENPKYSIEYKSAYRAKYPDKIKESAKKARTKEPYIAKRKLHHRLRRAILRNARIEQITIEQLDALFKNQRGRCAICKIKLGKDCHLDHIMPLIKGGAHEMKNLQYLCPRCNIRKHSHHPIDFMQREGFLL
jgi:5-methylcytosine-specific restriction endonuclease McrA